MDVVTLTELFNYHIWANNQVWSCVESLTDEQFAQADSYSIGSVLKQQFHLMQTDWSSAHFMLHGSWPSGEGLKEEDFQDRSALRARWDEVEADLRAGLAGLSEAQLGTTMDLPAGDGKTFTISFWEFCYTLVNHGTNHRAQCLDLISKLGGKTAEQGAYFYYMQR